MSMEIKFKPIEKELSLLFMATGFIKLYLDHIKEDNEDLKDYSKPIKLLENLRKRTFLYSKKLDGVVAKSNFIFEQIESEIKKVKPLKRFEKRVRVNEDGDVEVNGLLFSCALILEHKDFKNRKLFLDYKLAEDIHLSYDGKHSKSIDNARVMASKYVEAIKE